MRKKTLLGAVLPGEELDVVDQKEIE